MGIVSFSLLSLYNRYSFRKTQLFDLIILTMKFITLQFLGVAMLMMQYTFAAPLSEERRKETEMLRGGNEMLRGGNEMLRGGKPMRREEASTSAPGYGCDLEDHLQGGGTLHLLGSCK